MNDHLWGPSVHVDKSFTKIQARVRPPPIQAMPAFWEHLVLAPLPNRSWLVWLLNGHWRSSETLKDHKTKVWECVAKTNMKYTLNEENISASTNIKEKTQSKLQWSCSEARRDDDDDDEEEEEEEEWRWWCRWYSSVSECSSFEWPSSSGRINSGTSVKSKRASIKFSNVFKPQ